MRNGSFELAKVSPDIVERHSREHIRDYLLDQMAHVDYNASVVNSKLEEAKNKLKRLEQGEEDHKEAVEG